MSTLASHLHAAFHVPNTRVYRFVQGGVWALILLSILLLVAEALLPETTLADDIVKRVDVALLTIFPVEILLRVGTFQPLSLKVFKRPPMGRVRAHVLARVGYLVRPIMLVDILAVLALFPELRCLRALRLLRLLRTSRVFRYRNPFAIVVQSLEENSLLFGLAFSVLGVATLLGGVSMYLVEFRVNPDIGSV